MTSTTITTELRQAAATYDIQNSTFRDAIEIAKQHGVTPSTFIELIEQREAPAH